MKPALVAFVLLIAASPAPSPVPSASPAASSSAQSAAIALAQNRLDTMLRTGHADPAWFSPAFLDQIPASKVDAVIAAVVAALGAYKSIELTPTRFVAHFANGSDDILIHLDANNQIDGLLFKPPVAASSL